ncbi:hypothetical protein [Loigolactobacillus binensis]|uniref:Glycosyltransferase RgtA/B/C/D-like domain-containing protein n=1 Tax=Loigolactobacillus binensis TaxID=2559922 RepID=A0ABW3E7P6_9LACO|nr:hypothetical protein [Loigolactobacillus binensis]
MQITKLLRGAAVFGFSGLALISTLFALGVTAKVTQLTAGLTLVGAVLLFLLLKLGLNWLLTCRAIVQRYLLADLLVLIGLIQVLVATNFVDYGRADSFFVRNQAVSLAAHGTTWAHYFYVYSNNVNLALFESRLVELAHWLHFTDPWILINLLQFLWIDVALFAGLKILSFWRLPQLKIPFALLWLFAVPLYAYGVYIYSNSLVLPLPLLIVALWLWWQRSQVRIIPAALLVSSLVFGVLIKPNMIVAVIAFLLLLLGAAMQRRLTKRTLLAWVCGLLLTLGVALSLMTTAARLSGYKSEPDQALPFTSWIAMGLNQKTNGEYNYRDAHRQMQLPIKRQKVVSESKLIQKRLRRMGFKGLTQHLGAKAMIFLTDGTFGSFHLTSQWQREPQWYFQHQAKIKLALTLWTQTMYGTALLSCARLFIRKKRLAANPFLLLFMLGLACFHIVFWEVETRYALPLLPIFLLWATVGQTQTAPLGQKIARSFSLRSLIVISASLLALGLADQVLRTKTKVQLVSEQGNGKYFDNLQQVIPPHGQLQTKILTATANSVLVLQPSGQLGGRVHIILKNEAHVLSNITGDAKLLSKIHYPTQEPGTLELSIQNISEQAVGYGDAQSSYPIARYHIAGSQNTYLRYYIKQT